MRYTHEIHCNADRRKPVGCDMCSCRLGIIIKEMTKRRKIEVEKRELTDAVFWLNKAVDNTHKEPDEIEEYVQYALICLHRALTT